MLNADLAKFIQSIGKNIRRPEKAILVHVVDLNVKQLISTTSTSMATCPSFVHAIYATVNAIRMVHTIYDECHHNI